MTAAALIALDWGSSSVRAFRFASGGEVLAVRSSASGASRLPPEPLAFEQALRELLGDWLDAARPCPPIVACGMVGSAHGWKEAPYLRCPLALGNLHAQMARVTGTAGLAVHIVPGLLHVPANGSPDVMRGEETQVAGLLALHPRFAAAATIVLPGTHSKWVECRDGRVESFATRMTGELYAVLGSHSVLGRLMQHDAAFDEAAFDAGLALGRDSRGGDLAHHLFSVRSRGLTSEFGPAQLPHYLSGLLIGGEVAAALAVRTAETPLLLVGEPELCTRYRRAVSACGGEVAAFEPNTAPRGLWRIAGDAALL